MMRKKIWEKIRDLQTKPVSINRFFKINPRELDTDPERYLLEIEEYLERHGEKTYDFTLESWIDPEDFSLVVMVKIFPLPEIGVHLIPSNLLNLLVPSSYESDILRERVQNVFFKYEWDFYNDETIDNIVNDLNNALLGSSKDLRVFTRSEFIDNPFFVSIGEKEFSLSEYLEYIENKKRYEE